MGKINKTDLAFGIVFFILFGIPLLALIYGIGTKYWYHEIRKEIPADCGQYTVLQYENKQVPKRCVEAQDD